MCSDERAAQMRRLHPAQRWVHPGRSHWVASATVAPPPNDVSRRGGGRRWRREEEVEEEKEEKE